ncbi:MAG: aldo/keto reductase [Gemmatimonadales bacterium]
MLIGQATSRGTNGYALRMGSATTEKSFRVWRGLRLATVGIGTYAGGPSDDALYAEALATALTEGVNVVDTARSYRGGASERVVGEVFARLVGAKVVCRNEAFVVSKVGFLPDLPVGGAGERLIALRRQFVSRGLFAWGDLVDGCHCIAPTYIRYEMERSRQALQLATIDAYLIHNPERQLSAASRSVVTERMRCAFETLEQACADGGIGCYGVATWDGLRYRDPDDSRALSLEVLVGLAQQVGGSAHHFGIVQVPYNASLVEAYTQRGQLLLGAQTSALRAAQELGLYVLAAASLNRGRAGIEGGSPGFPPELRTPAQRALQFARGTPGVGTALVGMRQIGHVVENMQVLKCAPPTASAIATVFASNGWDDAESR